MRIPVMAIGFGAGKTEKWWIMGEAAISLGRKDPRCRPRPHGAHRLYGTRLKGNGLLAIRTLSAVPEEDQLTIYAIFCADLVPGDVPI